MTPRFAVLDIVDRSPDALTDHLSRFVSPVEVLPLSRGARITSRGSIAPVGNLVLWEGFHASGSEMVPTASTDVYNFYFPHAEGLQGLGLKGWVQACAGQGLIHHSETFSSIRLMPGLIQRGFSLDRRFLLDRLALALGQDLTKEILFDVVVHTEKIAGLANFSDRVLRSIVARDFDQAPGTLDKLPALIADMTLELLPHSYVARLNQPRLMIAPRHVKLAIDYIQAHPLDALPLDELARTCGVSLRALQYGFMAYVGLSPREYRRNVRLDRARQELETGAAESVSAAARKWGFVHSTRFRAQFLKRFGALPRTIS